MIPFFPDPYPDELFYSMCARFSDRVRYPAEECLMQELFGTRTAVAIVELPNRLANFVTTLPLDHRYTVDLLIDEHTLLPFYSPFLPNERLNLIRENMEGSNQLMILMRSGILASALLKLKRLRFCPLCAESDRKQFSESYWHRVHQVPGVEVCPNHAVFLENSNVGVSNGVNRQRFISAEQAIQTTSLRSLNLSNPIHKALLRIAQDAAWLLNQRNLVPGIESVRNRYLILLDDRKLVTVSGSKVRVHELIKVFKDYYPPNFLKLLQCEIDENNSNNWLFRLVRSAKQVQPPLRHLLLIQFLGFSAQEFFNLPSQPKPPFGEGPWPCLNQASDHFQQLLVKECNIKYDSFNGRITGMFPCTCCGFTYSRTGPDQTLEDRFRVSKIKSYGSVWETALKNMWSDSMVSVKIIARHLGVTPPTVTAHAGRLGLEFPRPSPQGSQVSSPSRVHKSGKPKQEIAPNILDSYRTAWLSAIEANPEAGRALLQQKFQATYAWLSRNDRQWLEEHMPSPKKAMKRYLTYVDWESRDFQLVELVRASALRLRCFPGRPKRISRTLIGRDIEQLSLIASNLDKLPQTAQVLAEVKESREDYAIRRIEWAAEYFRQENINPKRYQLVLKAGGICPKLAAVPKVKHAINTALQSLELMGVVSSAETLTND